MRRSAWREFEDAACVRNFNVALLFLNRLVDVMTSVVPAIPSHYSRLS